MCVSSTHLRRRSTKTLKGRVGVDFAGSRSGFFGKSHAPFTCPRTKRRLVSACSPVRPHTLRGCIFYNSMKKMGQSITHLFHVQRGIFVMEKMSIANRTMLTTSSGLRIPNCSFWTRHSRADEKLNWDGMMLPHCSCPSSTPCFSPAAVCFSQLLGAHKPGWVLYFCTGRLLACPSFLLDRNAEIDRCITFGLFTSSVGSSAPCRPPSEAVVVL